MKLITAIIKPFELDNVRDALMACGVQGMTVTEVSGYGRHVAESAACCGSETYLKLSANLQIDVVVEDADTARLVDSILMASSSATADSGKIFVSSIGHAVRIRTGELDEAAL